MTVLEQTLKGADYNVYMKIPTFMMDELFLENGDWLKLRIGTGYFALVKTNEKRSGIQIKNNKVRFPQQFSHTYRVRSNDHVQMHVSGERLVFNKVK
ncbi:hypothetical protein [Brevibacillus porteri]|uniref:hypothetical protein n=1 Tax=Brevibacillus porteri TaxID=2126350 RepID=UPI00363A819D